MTPAPRTLGVWAGVAGFTAVAAGAFGAHALRGQLDADALALWSTASHYHLVHALAVLGAAWAAGAWDRAWGGRAGALFLAGIVLFSGSLYALALTGRTWLGAVTPLGGLAFLAGWTSLALAARSSGGNK